jgi:hypothetical protein
MTASSRRNIRATAAPHPMFLGRDGHRLCGGGYIKKASRPAPLPCRLASDRGQGGITPGLRGAPRVTAQGQPLPSGRSGGLAAPKPRP